MLISEKLKSKLTVICENLSTELQIMITAWRKRRRMRKLAGKIVKQKIIINKFNDLLYDFNIIVNILKRELIN